MSIHTKSRQGNLQKRTRAYLFRDHGRPETPREKVLSQFDNVKESIPDQQYTARCPAHGDATNSLSVGVTGDGKVLLHCHAGCSIDEIVAALHLSKADLFSHADDDEPMTFQKAYSAYVRQMAARSSASKQQPSITDATLRHWAELTARCVSQLTPERLKAIAKALGVTRKSLQALQIGWYHPKNFSEGVYTFPERDGHGNVIGISTRGLDGSKKVIKTSKRGLYLPAGWDKPSGPIHIVEGASDTAALVMLDVAVVGRPSATGGVELLAQLLANVPAERVIIVMGEYDPKPDGKWPGLAGAQSVAEKLATHLNRHVRWSMPPEGAKDVRQWVRESGTDDR